MKKKFFILVISFCALILILDNYVTAQPTEEQQQLTQEQIEAFRAAKTVRIVIDTNVPSLPFGEVSRKLLEGAGLKIAWEDGDPYDVTLEIVAAGTARSSRYGTVFGSSQNRHYSGAILNGRISLFTETRPGYFKNFRGEINPPSSIKKAYPTVESAPYGKAFEAAGSFVPTLIDLMRDIYGVPCLLDYLKATDEVVRKHALNSLGRLNDINSVDPLIEALGYDDPDVRRKAARSLGKIKDLRAVEPLTAALGDNDYQVRLEVVSALKDIKDLRAVEPLTAALGDNDPEVREAVVKALRDIKDLRAVEPLIAALGDNDPVVRKAVVKALGELGDSRAFDALVTDLKDKEKSVNSDAIRALGKIDDPRVFDVLVTTMKDKDMHRLIRDSAGRAIGRLGEPRALEILLACLKDDDVGLRRASVYGLGQFRDPRAIEAIIGASGDEDWSVKSPAQHFLFQITGKMYNKKMQKKYQKWWDKNKKNFLRKK